MTSKDSSRFRGNLNFVVYVPQGIPVALDKHVLGFDTGGEYGNREYKNMQFLYGLLGSQRLISELLASTLKSTYPSDATLNEAAQILRLLHIEELRELQTRINEAIVAVQAIIADPKTDHRLDKVGR